MLINATKIGSVGGLRSFTDALASCFGDTPSICAVLPEGVTLAAKVRTKHVPAWLASSGAVSVFRPLAWWCYGASMFPADRKAKVLSSTHHVLPFRKRQVVTVHDLRPYFYPDSFIQRINFHHLLPKALKRCDGVLTVSETSKSLLASIYGLESSRIYVVPNIIDCEFYRPGSHRMFDSSPYLLSVGSSWKHKNVSELLRMHRCWAASFQLKIVAGAGQYQQELKRVVIAEGIADRVEFLTGVTSEELRLLYQNCAALVYPSIMEGFGLPPLESMACGRPAIVSDIPVFRELYGDAAIFVQLDNIESWEAAFDALNRDVDARREAGLAQARKYSQERMRTAVLSAIQSIWGESVLEESKV